MKELFLQNWMELYQGVPERVYVGLLSFLCLGTVLMFAFFGIRRGVKLAAVILLIEYLFLLFSSTVICRVEETLNNYNFTPFWSYKAVQVGQAELIAENVMNVMVFIPIGLLLGCVFHSMTWKKVLLIGCGISIMIEVMQFFLRRGFSETDDVIHNTLGCMIGYGVYKMIKSVRCKRAHV